MKFIASKIHWIGILLLVGFTAAAAGLYFDTPARSAKKIAPTKSPEVHAAPAGSPSHAGCNHGQADAQAPQHSCGMTASPAEASGGCCGEKKETAKMVLPAGHPPIEGYTIATEAHAGCAHAAEEAVENTTANP